MFFHRIFWVCSEDDGFWYHKSGAEEISNVYMLDSIDSRSENHAVERPIKGLTVYGSSWNSNGYFYDIE